MSRAIPAGGPSTERRGRLIGLRGLLGGIGAIAACALGIRAVRAPANPAPTTVEAPSLGTSGARPLARGATGVDVRVPADPSLSVSGRVSTMNGAPLAGATVCPRPEKAGRAAAHPCARTAPDGSFAMRLTSPLPAALMASARAYSPSERTLSGATGTAVVDFSLAEGQSGTLAGVVLDATGGTIPGARVTSYRGVDLSASSPVEVTEADASGRFALSLSGEEALVSARADGYSIGSRRVAAGARSVSLVLSPASAIGGRVVEADGRHSLDGVDVRLIEPGSSTAGVVPMTTTGGGAFRFEDLGAGSYLVQVTTPRYRSEPRLVQLGLGEVAEDVELTVYPAVSVSGVVSLASGEPCRAGQVELLGPQSLVGGTGENGQVQIDGVPAGLYSAVVRCGGGLSLTEELEVGTESVRREWTLDAGLTLVGSVVNASGGAYAGAQVFVASEVGGNGASEGEPAVDYQGTFAADPSGEFRATGLHAGTYTVQLSSCREATGAAVEVVVAPGADNAVTLTAPAHGTIQVQLPELDANAAAALQISATHRESGKVHTTTRLDGFVFDGLPLGTYQVSLEPCDTGPRAATTAGSRCEGESVEVSLDADGQVVEARLVLESDHVIQGRVVDERGAPVPDAWVSAEHDVSAPGADPSVSVLSDTEGEFRLTGLSRGRYVLRAKNAVGEASGVPVASDSNSALLRVQRFGRIEGSVRTRGGRVASQFQVQYLDETGEGGAAIGTGGRFSLPWLRPGRYDVSVTSEGGAASQTVLLEPGVQQDLPLVLSSATPTPSQTPQ